MLAPASASSSSSSSSSTTPARFNTKSRKGCSECKRKRVKCDETKPVCVRCQKSRHPTLCDYSLKLSWSEGRPYKKSRTEGPDSSVVPDLTVHHDSTDARSPSDASSRVVVSPAQHVQQVVEPSSSLPLSSAPLPVAVPPVSPPSLSSHPSIPENTTNISTSAGVPINEVDTPSQFADAPDDDSLLDTHTVGTLAAAAQDQEDVDDWVNSPLVSLQKSKSMTIPPSISAYPTLCPSESPNAYFYLHHYSVHTATTLFPLLPPASRDSLLSVAASNPSLLSALLAISVDQYGRLRGDSSPEIERRAAFYSRKALTGLQKAMMDPNQATTFATISTVLALCTHDVLMSGHVQGWKTHLRGAEQLLTMSIGKSRESATVTDPATLFLIKWFAAIDIFAGISSLERTLVPDGRYWSIGFSTDGSTQYVDDFVGFSLELMPILSRISRMARLQQRKTSLAASLGTDYAEVADDLDSLLSDNVQHTEQQLISLLSTVSAPPLAGTSPAILAEDTQHTHRLFVYAALLHLYRRVQELPKDHPKPEHATSKIIDILDDLRPDSPASIVILWPLFSAGCETIDPERRRIIKARMIGLRRWGMGNVDQALEAMEEYWQSDTSERWDVFLGRLGVDLVLF
ncbi:hypothetical protein AAFC00_000792 [Neodothiora populina]|uniref:Zn(2)-C6 fungal-type domain-containing protein n=1 Tax=Neodothiora populina TaxID=2781224 RepID=A0ABR3PM62_9PEZI